MNWEWLVEKLSAIKVSLGLVLAVVVIAFFAGRYGNQWLHTNFVSSAQADEIREDIQKTQASLDFHLQSWRIESVQSEIGDRQEEMFRVRIMVSNDGPSELAEQRIDQLAIEIEDLMSQLDCIRSGDC